jgi:hypothetical protein
MREEFATHKLNAEGMAKAVAIGMGFELLLAGLEKTVELAPDARGLGARQMAIVRTKLEESCFFAKKAMAVQAKNQETTT